MIARAFRIELVREPESEDWSVRDLILHIDPPKWSAVVGSVDVGVERVHDVFSEELQRALGEAVGIAAQRTGDRLAREGRV